MIKQSITKEKQDHVNYLASLNIFKYFRSGKWDHMWRKVLTIIIIGVIGGVAYFKYRDKIQTAVGTYTHTTELSHSSTSQVQSHESSSSASKQEENADKKQVTTAHIIKQLYAFLAKFTDEEEAKVPPEQIVRQLHKFLTQFNVEEEQQSHQEQVMKQLYTLMAKFASDKDYSIEIEQISSSNEALPQDVESILIDLKHYKHTFTPTIIFPRGKVLYKTLGQFLKVEDQRHEDDRIKQKLEILNKIEQIKW